MAFATTNQTGLYSVEETTWGTVPSTPSLQELRFTGEGLNYEIENVISDEIRSDRMTSDTIQVGQSTTGNLDFELSYGTYDHFFESALYQTFVGSNTNADTTELTIGASGSNLEVNFSTGGTITFGSAHSVTYVAGQRVTFAGTGVEAFNRSYSITDVSGSVLTVYPAPASTTQVEQGTATGRDEFLASGATLDNIDIDFQTGGDIVFGSSHTFDFKVDQWIEVTGAATSSLNIFHRITAVDSTTNTITVTPAPAANETVETGAVISGSRLRNAPTASGITEKSFTIQKRFNDATSVIYQNLTGMIADSMSLSFESGSILTGSFNFTGKGSSISTSQEAGATDVAATSTDVMNAVSNLKNIEFDDTDTTASLISMTFDTSGNLRQQDAIGSLASVGVGTGRLEAGGDISIYFENLTEYQKFLDNTSFKLSFRLEDADGNAYVFTIPKVKYEGMTMNAGGLDADIELTGTYQALLGNDGSENYQIQIDRLPV